MCAATFGEDLTEVKKVLPYKGIELFIKLNALKYVVNKEMHGHGIGRHTYEEIWSIGEKDLRALSTFIGMLLSLGFFVVQGLTNWTTTL